MPKNNFTPKQRAFIAEYLLCRNATKAAKLAGYSPKTARSAGSRLLTNVDISKAIENGLAEQLEKAEISANNVLLELKRMAFSDITNGNQVERLHALELLGKSFGLFTNKPKPKRAEISTAYLLPPHHSR